MSTWRLDGFSEIGELGSGAQGRVVLARRGESGPLVAIKYVFDTGDESTRLPSQREARILASVENQHVARLHELVEGPGGMAMVMEAVDGVSLDKLLREHGALEPEAALLVLKGSLLGLAAAHAVGVVHRDYKPANVIVQADGVSKLIDFGIATPSGERSLTGTPAYMAPEQWSGEPATPATDVYAATCVFFECVAGHPPYVGDSQMALMVQHASAAPPVDQVPEPLRALVGHGMAKLAAQRPPGAAEFLTELEAAAVAAYGEDWERRGLFALAAAAAALAALFPQAAAISVVSTATAGTTTASTSLGQSVLGSVSRLPTKLGHTWLLPTVALAAAVVTIAAVALVLHKQSSPIALTRPGPSATSSAPAVTRPSVSPSPSPSPSSPTPTPTLPSPSPSQPPSPVVVPAGNPSTGPTATSSSSPTAPPVVPPCPRQTLPTYSFGSLQVKQAATQSFSFAWNSCYSATGITFRGDATAFTRELTGCPPASGAGNTCQIKVTFNPASSGEHQATLVVPDNTGADAVTIDLTGTATAESTDCFPYASKQDFGEVPVGTHQQMNFTYPWRSCDAIDQMQVVGGSRQFIATLTGCPPLARTDQCSFNVTFTPSDAGPQSANIVIPSDTGGQAVQIALTGTGTKVEVTTSPPQSGTTKPAPGVSDPVSPDPKPSTTAPSTSKPDPQPDPQPSTSKPDPQLSTLPNSSLEAAPQPKAFPTTP